MSLKNDNRKQCFNFYKLKNENNRNEHLGFGCSLFFFFFGSHWEWMDDMTQLKLTRATKVTFKKKTLCTC